MRFRNTGLQIDKGCIQRLATIHRSRTHSLTASYPCVSKQVCDEGTHPTASFQNLADEHLSFAVKSSAQPSRQQLRVGGYSTQRFLQVVASGVGKPLQILICTLEFLFGAFTIDNFGE